LTGDSILKKSRIKILRRGVLVELDILPEEKRAA
jgi:hypothetical protein